MVGFAGSFQRKRSRMSGKSVLNLVLCMTMVLGMLSGIRLTAKADGEKVAVLKEGVEIARFQTLTQAYMFMFFEMDEVTGLPVGYEDNDFQLLEEYNGDTIMLLDDVTINENLWLGPSFNLALNGKTFTVNEGVDISPMEGYSEPSICVGYVDNNMNEDPNGGSIISSGSINACIEVGRSSQAYVNGGYVYGVQTYGTVNVSGGVIGSLGLDDGTTTITGGRVTGLWMMNLEGSPTLTIQGNAQIVESEDEWHELSALDLNFCRDSGEDRYGRATVTISGAPQIESIDFQFDEGEGVWGSLTITGGYFGNDPQAVLDAYEEDADHITAVINEVEEYNSQSNWIEDHETYGWRIVGGDYGDDGNENVSYTVAFNTNGGTQIADQNVEANGVAVKPEDPTKEHYSFVNWYADEAFTTPFDFVAPITADTTVYAKWNYEMEVESQDNTEASTEAAEEVKKLVEQIVAGNEVEGMDAALVGKINDAIADGKDIKVQVTSPKVAEADVQADADKIREKARETVGNDAVVAAFYDIDVNVLIDGALAGNVTKLGHKIPLRLAVPDDLPAVPAGFTRVFSVFKLHGGVASKLSANMNGIWCEFESDEFSTYALVYEDVKDGDDDDDDDAQTVTTTSTTAATTQNVVKSPKTGDQAPYSLWIAISCLGMAGLVSRRACRRE